MIQNFTAFCHPWSYCTQAYVLLRATERIWGCLTYHNKHWAGRHKVKICIGAYGRINGTPFAQLQTSWEQSVQFSFKLRHTGALCEEEVLAPPSPCCRDNYILSSSVCPCRDAHGSGGDQTVAHLLLPRRLARLAAVLPNLHWEVCLWEVNRCIF